MSSFRTAAAANDTNNINRYFKLFPIIQEDSKGLEVYAEWVSGIVRAKIGALSTKSECPVRARVLQGDALIKAAILVQVNRRPTSPPSSPPSSRRSLSSSLSTNPSSKSTTARAR